jgi:glutathione S-transferase
VVDGCGEEIVLALYHNDMSSCAQKVRLCLAEKALEWESRHLDLRAGEHQQPWYIKLNPRAVVPTLIDDETVIPESNVINEYLDDRFPERPLRPSDPYGCACGPNNSMKAFTMPALPSSASPWRFGTNI